MSMNQNDNLLEKIKKLPSAVTFCIAGMVLCGLLGPVMFGNVGTGVGFGLIVGLGVGFAYDIIRKRRR